MTVNFVKMDKMRAILHLGAKVDSDSYLCSPHFYSDLDEIPYYSSADRVGLVRISCNSTQGEGSAFPTGVYESFWN